jgi:hypothetical protein
LGCLVCGAPAEIHHITTGVGMGQRASNYQTIPLCSNHHRNGGHGVAIHAGKRTWEATFGREVDLLAQVNERLNTEAA